MLIHKTISGGWNGWHIVAAVMKVSSGKAMVTRLQMNRQGGYGEVKFWWKGEIKNGMIGAIVGVMFALGGCCYVPEAGVKSPVSHQSQWLMSIGTPFGGMPKDAKLLHEIGDLTLFVGETESDVVFNAKSRDESRNSL